MQSNTPPPSPVIRRDTAITMRLYWTQTNCTSASPPIEKNKVLVASGLQSLEGAASPPPIHFQSLSLPATHQALIQVGNT
jgi:hypothetical protein